MQDELLRIQRGVRKTVLFVTHDVDEAFKLGDQIAVLSEGQLVQIGTPIELLTRPANDFVRELVGADNTLRQLQYLPVTAALDHEAAGTSSQYEDTPTCDSRATLLDAMLQLLQTRAPALTIVDGITALGPITLVSINRQITTIRSKTEQAVSEQAESRI